MIYSVLLAFSLCFVFAARAQYIWDQQSGGRGYTSGEQYPPRYGGSSGGQYPSTYGGSSGGQYPRCENGKVWHRCKPCDEKCGVRKCGYKGGHPDNPGFYGIDVAISYSNRDSPYGSAGGSSYGYQGSGGYGGHGGGGCGCRPGCACPRGSYWDKQYGKCARCSEKETCPKDLECRCLRCVPHCPRYNVVNYKASYYCTSYLCRKQCTCPYGKYLDIYGNCVSRLGCYTQHGYQNIYSPYRNSYQTGY